MAADAQLRGSDVETENAAGAMPEAEAETAFLRIRNLTKMFGAFTALDDISLDVQQGQFVCFLGPSGCGKTTLLRCIAGLETQTHGSIEQGERDISVLPPAGRDFGIVFQSYALFPNLTVVRNVAYGLGNRGMKRAAIRERVAELLALVGLEGQEDKYPAQLSGGQQQRVALARALAPSPGLLLLDEPLSALDAKVRMRLRHEVRQLHRRLGVTTVMVTHDQEEALTMADRIVVMNQGVIDQVGSPVEIYRNPASPFVADFVGTMNFLDVEVADAGRVRAGPIEVCHEQASRFAGAGRAILCVRPEDVEIAAPGEEGPHVVDGDIQDTEFMGSFFRVILEIPGLPAPLLADFSINEARALQLDPGGRLRVSLPAERALLFAADARG
jgi:iron(III) transport system ATP-binding protein